MISVAQSVFCCFVASVINAHPGAHATENSMPQITSKSLESRTGSEVDPGAIDNRLSVNPNDPNWKDEIAGLEDGEECELRIPARVISPGEFAVLGLSVESKVAEEEEDEEAEPPMAKNGKSGVSKAVQSMMAEEGA